jgi:hypothetical protein
MGTMAVILPNMSNTNTLIRARSEQLHANPTSLAAYPFVTLQKIGVALQ